MIFKIFHIVETQKLLSILMVISTLCLFTSCNGQKKESKKEKTVLIENEKFLLPYRVGEKWGLADTLGSLRVPAKYDSISDFRMNFQFDDNRKVIGIYSYYFVKENGKIKIIDSSGEQLLKEYEPMFRKGNNFIYTKNGKYGKMQIQYKDGNLKAVEEIPFIYDTIYQVGKYNYAELEGKKGVFKNDQILIPIIYDSIAYKTIDSKRFQGKYDEEWNAYTLNPKREIIDQKVFYEEYAAVEPIKTENVNEKPLLPKKKKATTSDIKKLIGLEKYDAYTMFETEVGQLHIVHNHDGKKYAVIGRNPKPDFELKFDYDSIYEVHINQSFLNYKKLLVGRKGKKYDLWASGFSTDSNPIREYDAVEQRKGKYKNGKEFPYVVFKKNGKYGADMFPIRGNKVINYIPFEFDDIIDNLFVVKNGKYGVYRLTEDKDYIKIEPKYRQKPILYRENKQKVILYECVTDEGEKILVYRNGLELYRKN